eukprot:jgi/Botrbrau1/12056/Bobra.0295s0011.1
MDVVEELHQKVNDSLQDYGSVLGDLVEAPFRLPLGENEAEAVHVAQLRQDEHLDEWYRVYYRLRQRSTETSFNVAVMALTKSGKSTLLNAFIGRSLLPVSNAPETALITKLVLANEVSVPELSYQEEDGTHVVKGDDAIRAKLLSLHKDVRARRYLQSNEDVLRITTDIQTVHHALMDSNVSLCLLDTPGPNEAGEEGLRHQVERMLETVDAVVYLLDYTKLKTQEEASLLQRLKEINPQLVKRLSQRLFFVVNKADVMHSADGMGEVETKEYVAGLITRTLQQEGFQLEPEQVLLVSAHDALLAKLIMWKRESPEELERFIKLEFGRRASKKPHEQLILDAAFERLEASGLPLLEEKVIRFLCTNSRVLKLVAVVDDFSRALSQVANIATAKRAALEKDVKVLQEKTQQLSAELHHVLEDLAAVQSETQEIQGRVIDEVQRKMQALKESLFVYIQGVMDGLKSASDVPPPNVSGRWVAVYRKFQKFFAKDGAKGTDAAAVRATLEELSAEIQHQIDGEVRDFWHQLEVAATTQQHELYAIINKQLDKVSAAIEASVGEILNVRLEPVNLRIEIPTSEDFHNSLAELFKHGVSHKHVTKTRLVTEEVPIWHKRSHGLCRTDFYYGATKMVRTSRQYYTETEYELDLDKIKAYFMESVEKRVQVSVSHVRMFVEAYMGAQIESARDAVHDYGNRYAIAMSNALSTSQSGEAARLHAIQTMDRNLLKLEELQATCTHVLKQANNCFPEVMAGFLASEAWLEVPSASISECGEPQVALELPQDCIDQEDGSEGSSSKLDVCSSSNSTPAVVDGGFANFPAASMHPTFQYPRLSELVIDDMVDMLPPSIDDMLPPSIEELHSQLYSVLHFEREPVVDQQSEPSSAGYPGAVGVGSQEMSPPLLPRPAVIPWAGELDLACLRAALPEITWTPWEMPAGYCSPMDGPYDDGHTLPSARSLDASAIMEVQVSHNEDEDKYESAGTEVEDSDDGQSGSDSSTGVDSEQEASLFVLDTRLEDEDGQLLSDSAAEGDDTEEGQPVSDSNTGEDAIEQNQGSDSIADDDEAHSAGDFSYLPVDESDYDNGTASSDQAEDEEMDPGHDHLPGIEQGDAAMHEVSADLLGSHHQDTEPGSLTLESERITAFISYASVLALSDMGATWSDVGSPPSSLPVSRMTPGQEGYLSSSPASSQTNSPLHVSRYASSPRSSSDDASREWLMVEAEE